MTRLDVAQEPQGSMEGAVRARYAASARSVEADLCCAVTYDPRLLGAIPKPVVELDHGCGEPTRWVGPGETVLDLGSGSGKLCYMLSQVVGPTGRVIGVDFNSAMLEVARRHQGEFAARMGFDNMGFRKGRIQDLALDLEVLEAWLAEHPVGDADGYLALGEHISTLRAERPLIESESIDCLVSNCVLNLVDFTQRGQLFAEMHRVLKNGGRCVVSDIVSDEDVPERLRSDPDLWSGCISGTYREDRFLKAFERAGFYGIEIVDRAEKAWKVIEGIEFRSVTVRAYRGKEGPCIDKNQAVIYRGPWRSVTDDDGHTFRRGEPAAVCEKTFEIMTRAPYETCMIGVQPRVPVPDADARTFDCQRGRRRDPRELKGAEYRQTSSGGNGQDCESGSCC